MTKLVIDVADLDDAYKRLTEGLKNELGEALVRENNLIATVAQLRATLGEMIEISHRNMLNPALVLIAIRKCAQHALKEQEPKQINSIEDAYAEGARLGRAAKGAKAMKLDIVEWLRREAELVDLTGLNEAANTIEKLRAALEEIASHWDGYVLKDLSAADVMDIVKRALTDEQKPCPSD